jgi:hypothetical protein
VEAAAESKSARVVAENKSLTKQKRGAEYRMNELKVQNNMLQTRVAELEDYMGVLQFLQVQIWKVECAVFLVQI